MDENENKKIYRPKRPKIKARDNGNNNLDNYTSMTEENIEINNRYNLKLKRDFIMNDDNNIKKERKRSVQSKRGTRRPLTDFQKKIKQLIIKINSPLHKLKHIFHRWAFIALSQKNKLYDDEEEEDE